MRILLIIIFLSLALSFSNQALAQGQVQKLIIKTTDNQNFDLSQKKDKVVIIAFFAGWCSICTVEINDLEDLYKKYHSHGLEVIGINIDGDIKNAAKLSYPIAILDNAKVNNFNRPNTIPMLYVVSRDGLLHSKLYKAEEIKVENLDRIVRELLMK